jgi:hypothetical protein
VTAAVTAAVQPERGVVVAAALVGAAGVAVLAGGLALSRPVLVAPAAALLGAAYATGRVAEGGPADLQAPLVAAALLVTCELAYWSHELRTTSPDEPGALPRRVSWLALLAVGAYLCGVLVLALADLVRLDGIAIEVVGVAAAAVLAGGLVVLARRGQPAA